MKKLYTFFYLCCILISFIACDREKVEYTEGGDPQMVDIRLSNRSSYSTFCYKYR